VPVERVASSRRSGETSETVPPAAARGAVARWARDERVLWRLGPGFVVLLAPGDAAPISLRGTGVALWAALDRPRTVPEVVAQLAGEFDADPDVVRPDIEPVIARLAEAGAIRSVP
jgi:hypothetical protein